MDKNKNAYKKVEQYFKEFRLITAKEADEEVFSGLTAMVLICCLNSPQPYFQTTIGKEFEDEEIKRGYLEILLLHSLLLIYSPKILEAFSDFTEKPEKEISRTVISELIELTKRHGFDFSPVLIEMHYSEDIVSCIVHRLIQATKQDHSATIPYSHYLNTIFETAEIEMLKLLEEYKETAAKDPLCRRLL